MDGSCTGSGCEPSGCLLIAGIDCNDTDASINPWALEIPYDGIDQDCSGYDLTDADGDGYDSTVVGGSDCDDNNPLINPATYWYEDSDGDTYGNPLVSLQQCLQLSGYVLDNTDCDDTDAAINPLSYWHPDHDGDGYGNPSISIQQCVQLSGYVLNNTDCDDNDPNIYPGGPTVRIIDAPPVYYLTLQNAYDAALDGDIIQCKDVAFIGDIAFDINKSVTVVGGYDCGYMTNSGTTTVNGNITISNGTVTLENFDLH